ncbi:MLP-LIKE PROTEIN 423 [Salix koriyanagi]|uniref:MLP-LIKE PROTEIN 423 n=1 Tax=Salix koriyanagi TaxID=2511006 RepID=A0A9Q0WKG1_9ROSI|nr:MLP-LIKE PROTEIN 423 [Salix koriyanagi]
MAQIATLEVQTEIKSSADQFYEIFRSKQYLMPKICPEYIKGVQVVHGDWEAVGSIKLWTYVAGSSEIVKDTVEAIDDKTKSITYNILEGKILTYYKAYKSTVQVTTTGQTAFAKWTVEYERQNEEIPDPNNYVEFLACISKSVDAYLLKMW